MDKLDKRIQEHWKAATEERFRRQRETLKRYFDSGKEPTYEEAVKDFCYCHSPTAGFELTPESLNFYFLRSIQTSCDWIRRWAQELDNSTEEGDEWKNG